MRLRSSGGAARIARLVTVCAVGAFTAIAQPQPVSRFTPSERWSHYLHRTYAPARLGLLAAETAIDHALRQPACWDSAAGSYLRRYGRASQRRVVRNTAELVAGLVTGEDLRYRASGSRLIPERAWNALASSITARLPDGSRRPAYTRFFATALADVSTARWTNKPIRPGSLFQSLALSSIDQMQTNLLDEFGPDLRRMAVRLWKQVRSRR